MRIEIQVIFFQMFCVALCNTSTFRATEMEFKEFEPIPNLPKPGLN